MSGYGSIAKMKLDDLRTSDFAPREDGSDSSGDKPDAAGGHPRQSIERHQLAHIFIIKPQSSSDWGFLLEWIVYLAKF